MPSPFVTHDDLAAVVPDLIGTAVAEMAVLTRRQPALTLATGTVESANADGTVNVQFDEDEPVVLSVVQGSALAGERVNVLLRPSGGASILGNFTPAGGQISLGGPVPSGALLGSVPNVVTALTTLDEVGSGVPSFVLRHALGTGAGSLVTNTTQLGLLGFAGKYDSTANHYLAPTAGFFATAVEDFTVAHGGTHLEVFTTPKGSVTNASVQRWLSTGDTKILGGTVDANGYLLGGGLRQVASITIAQPALNWTGAARGLQIASDAQITAGLFTVFSASAPFLATDVGKYVYVRDVGVTPPPYSAMSGYVTAVSTDLKTATLDQPAIMSISAGSGLVSLNDPALGSPLNIVVNQKHSTANIPPAVGPQSSFSFVGNQGPRALLNLEGQVVINTTDSVIPIAFQSAVVVRNAPGVATNVARGTPGFNFADQLVADGATVTVVGDPGGPVQRMMVTNYTMNTVNGGAVDASIIELREFQTESGLGKNVHLMTRVGLMINQFGVTSRSTAADGSTNVLGNPLVVASATANFTSADIGRLITGAGIATGTTIVGITSSIAATISQPCQDTRTTSSVFTIQQSTLDNNYGLFIRKFQPAGTALLNNVGIGTQMPIEFLPTNANLTSAGNGLPSPFYDDPMVKGFIYVDNANTYTIDFGQATIGAVINFGGTWQFQQNANNLLMFAAYSTGSTFKNVNGVVANLGPVYLFNAQHIIEADGASITSPANRDVYSHPIYKTISGGTLTATAHTSFFSGLRVLSGVTLANRYGFDFQDANASGGSLGTVTTQTAINIPALSGATNNHGIVNASTLEQSGTATFTGTVDLTGATVTGLSAFTVNSVPVTATGASLGGIMRVDSTTSGASLIFQRLHSTAAAQSGDTLGNVLFAGLQTGTTYPFGAGVRGVADGTNWDSTHRPGRLEFLTAPTNSGLVVNALIDNAGTFYIGPTAAGAVASIDQSGNLIAAGNATISGAASVVLVRETTQQLAGYAMEIKGGLHVHSGFLGLNFISTQFNGGAASLDLRSTQASSLATSSASLSGDVLGAIHFGGDDGHALEADVAQIYCVATQNYAWSTTTTQAGSRLEFYTTPNGPLSGKRLVFTLGQDASATVVGGIVGTSTLAVTGAATLSSTLAVAGVATFSANPAINTAVLPALSFQLDTGSATISAGVTGQIAFDGVTDASHTLYAGATIRAVTTEAYSGTAGGTKLEFRTTPNTTHTPAIALTLGQDQSVTAAGALIASTTFAVTGAATLSSTLAVTGVATFSTNPIVNTASIPGLGVRLDTGAATGSGGVIGLLSFQGATDASSTIYTGASIQAVTTQAYTGSNGGTQLRLRTTPNGTHTLTTAVTIDQDQSVMIAGNTILSGALRNTPQAITMANGANNNIDTTSSVIVVTGPSGAFNITGFTRNGAAPNAGDVLIVINTTTGGAMTITNNATSTAANRLRTMTGADVVCTAAGGSCAWFVYDAVTSFWNLISVQT